MRTKTILPRRQKDLLSRHRLLSMLDDLLEYRLSLIAAPAGYGKTSLLVDLADKVEYPVCWLAIDPLDLDPLRFIHYFIAAIQGQFSEFGGPSNSLIDNLGGNELDQQQMLRTIVNDLYDNVQEHFALVLDDFHLIDSNPDIVHFINQFIQEMDDNCHLVIVSRSLLSLPDLPLMIGRSQVIGLSFEELAFHADEIKDLYKIKYQQDMSVKEAERIEEDTEGWITGLLLSAEATGIGLTDQGRAARAAGIDLYDYLAQQVLDQQTPEMQDFLLRTSLLEEFNAELCLNTFGDPEGKNSWEALIQQLLQKNLFIQPVENRGTWLRYHHLLRDFLQQHYQKHHPEQAHELLLKLVDVYRDHGWYEKAYAACQILGDEELTADFIESVSPTLFHTGQLSVLKSWLDELSPIMIENNPGLLGNRGALASITGDPETGLRMLNRALEEMSLDEDPALYSKVLIRRATCHRYMGNYQMGLDDALQALGLADKIQDGKILVPRAESEIGLNMQRLGLNQEAKEYLERSLASYSEQDDQRNAAFVQMDLGLMEMNGGDYSAARSLYKKAYQIWEDLGNLNKLVGLCNNLGVLDHQTGSYLEAFEWFKTGLVYARQTGNLREAAFTQASLADLALDLGALSRAEDYLDESEKKADEVGDTYLKIYLLLTRAALARRKGEFITAKERLDIAYDAIEELPDGYETARYHLENGLLFIAEDHQDQAYNEFISALELFSKINLPRKTSLTLVHLARIDCLRGSKAEAITRLNSVNKIIQSLGTLHPLIPVFSYQETLLSCLEDHLPEESFTRDLVRSVSEFRSLLPNILEKLESNIIPTDTPQQPVLEISGMGRISVEHRGELISVPEWTKQRTVRELFFYILSSEEGMSREEICLDFWPDSNPEQLKKQFKNALYRLRKAVGKDTILYDPLSRLYYFNRELDYRYDVEEFRNGLSQAEKELDPEVKVRIIQDAAAIYQHPFAPSLGGIWTEPLRYGLYLDYEKAMLTLAELLLSRGRSGSSLEIVEQLLIIMPSQEQAWRLAMRSYAESGDRSGIERTYQRCLQALAQDLDAEPSPETLSLYQDLMS